jgi:hypothetical protein
MTRRNAENITGLEIAVERFVLPKGMSWEATAIDEDGACLMISETTEKKAIEEIVDYVYRVRAEKARIRQDYRCFHCARITGLETDHIVPRARGGRDDSMENLRGLCPSCHRNRHDGEAIMIHPKVVAAAEEHGWLWNEEEQKWQKK